MILFYDESRGEEKLIALVDQFSEGNQESFNV